MNTAASAVPEKAYPELTRTAVNVGRFLGVINAVSIGYAALDPDALRDAIDERLRDDLRRFAAARKA